MIILKVLKWSNLFSYGTDNIIYFDKDPITQLVGKNGHGKSSIALILEEVLFNKNSKGIKKADILNRHSKSKSYSIGLEFWKDEDNYEISTVRGSTQTVSLAKNGENISAHTATATFKLLEEILGFDHKTFSQLVYQSSSASLEFLTATDTNRKKFLIDLLNLSRYVAAFEVFKAVAKEVSEELLVVSSKIKTTQTWLDKNLQEDLTPVTELVVPEIPLGTEEEQFELQEKLKTIGITNKKISQNNTYKEQLDGIDVSILSSPTVPVESDTEYHSKLGAHKKTIADSTALVNKIAKLNGTCPTCLQEINRDKLDELIKEQQAIEAEAQKAVKIINSRLLEISADKKEAARIAKIKSDWETYHSLVDPTLPTDCLDGEQLQSRINELMASILNIKSQIANAIKFNTKAAATNAKIRVIMEQADSMKSDLAVYNEELVELSTRLSILQILQKTFSTNGLIAYKIECLVKDLEIVANTYLSDLSDGRFQLTFRISAGDKLNVIITDNGRDIEILALSGGERARVNTATLLAIRKIMQSLSDARINLLILDETVDALDSDGKEKLVEVLLKEEHLNTFLVSHGFTHPLLEKINVIKEHNISRLE